LPFGGNNEGPNPSANPPGAAASPDAVNDARAVYPCTIHHNARFGGLYTLYAETAQARLEWKAKLEEAIGLRKIVQESNKVFEVETLSVDTFFASTWNNDGNFTGKVTCSVPFSEWPSDSDAGFYDDIVWLQLPLMDVVLLPLDVRKECGLDSDTIRGVRTPPPWSSSLLIIGVRSAMRRILHLRMVSQCAVLEDFGIFLVLADKVGQNDAPSGFGVADRLHSHSLPTKLKRSLPHHLGQRTPRRYPKSSVGTRTCSSSLLATMVVGHWSSI